MLCALAVTCKKPSSNQSAFQHCHYPWIILIPSITFNEYMCILTLNFDRGTGRIISTISRWLEHEITMNHPLWSSFDITQISWSTFVTTLRPVVAWPLCSMLLAQYNRLMLAPFCCFLKVGMTDEQCAEIY